jgi:hypothetical protein
MLNIKLLKAILLLMLVTISFAIGHYLSDRQAYKNQIINSDIKIIVTEILLNEHLKNCNKAGYRRFTTFHEHNIDKVYRMAKYANGYPYYINSDFVDEVKEMYDPHKKKLEAFKTEFEKICGDV